MPKLKWCIKFVTQSNKIKWKVWA